LSSIRLNLCFVSSASVGVDLWCVSSPSLGIQPVAVCPGQVYPLISKHYLLMVSLLLFNAAANETLPLFLNKLVPDGMVSEQAPNIGTSRDQQDKRFTCAQVAALTSEDEGCVTLNWLWCLVHWPLL
jgi:hypothetical protein